MQTKKATQEFIYLYGKYHGNDFVEKTNEQNKLIDIFWNEFYKSITRFSFHRKIKNGKNGSISVCPAG